MQSLERTKRSSAIENIANNKERQKKSEKYNVCKEYQDCQKCQGCKRL